MEKMLGKRFMFLVALLVGLCVPTMAQTSETATKTIDANSKASGKVDEEKSAEYSSNGTIGGTSSYQTPYLSIGSNSPLTISVPSGYMITEIKLSYTNNNSNRRGGTKTVKTYNGETPVDYTGSPSGATSSTYTISGISDGVNKVTITGNNTSRITKIEVTYKAAGLSVSGNTSIKVGQTSQLTVTGASGSVSYSSNDTSVATVDGNGLVKAVSPGTATITVKSGTASKTIDITVSKGDPTANLTAANNTITVGQTTKLTFTHTSDGSSVSYNTSNASIATVSTAGVVTAVGGGSVTITASVPATNKYNAVSRSVTITVNKKSDNSANLTATASTLTIDQTAQLTFTTTSDGPKSYSTNKSSVATVSNTGVVTAVGEGTATITATAASTTTYNQVQKTITITVNKKTGSATLSAANNTLAVGGTTQLTLSTTTNTGASVTYSTSSDKIAAVSSSGVVTAKGTGTATITANVGATSKYAATSASCTITVIAGTATNGTVYYIQNAATGLFLTYGGEWGFFAVEGRSAHPMVVNTNGDYKSLGSVAGYLGSSELWMDRPAAESKWTFESTGTGVAGSTGQFYIKNEHGSALISQGNRYGQLSLRAIDEADSRHKWNLYTKDQLLALSASVDNPVDITAIIQASSFDLADGQSLDAGPLKSISPFSTVTNLADKKRFVGFWANYPFPYDNHNWHSMIRGGWGQPGVYNGIGIIKNTTNKVTITQNIGTLKQGTYYFSFQGFYRYVAEGFFAGFSTGLSDEKMDVKVKVVYGNNNTTIKEFTLSRNSTIEIGEDIDNYEKAATLLKDYVSHEQHYQFTVPQSGYSNVKVIIEKPTTSSGGTFLGTGAEYYNWTCFDNFALVYYGTNAGNAQVDFNDLYESWLEKFIAEVVARVEGFDEEAQDLFDISDVIAGLGDIDNEAEYLEALEKIANEFQEAYHHHHSKPGTDATDFIRNPNFEEKNSGNQMNPELDAPGWTGGVKPNSTTGFTGTKDSWYGNGASSGLPITQEITVEKEGLYKLVANVGADKDNYVYLMANHYHKGFKSENSKLLKEVELYFMVTADNNKKAIIGVVGGSASEAEPNGEKKYYAYQNANVALGTPVRADNFRLTYVCDEANGYLKLALDEADKALAKMTPEARVIAEEGLRQYRTMYNTHSATGVGNAGKGPSHAVFRVLQSAAKSQNVENADMTYAIMNNSFEAQYYANWLEGWMNPYGFSSDGGPRENVEGYYTNVTDDDGRWVYNVWWQGTPLLQHIDGIPNGDYQLNVKLASSDANARGALYLSAGKYVLDENGAIKMDEEGRPVIDSYQKQKYDCFPVNSTHAFQDVTFNFTVEDNNVIIGVRGATAEEEWTEAGHWWYKADNFRLKYCGHNLILNEKAEEIKSINDWYTTVTLNRTLKANSTWSSFCAPFDISAELLVGWDVKELTSSSVSEDGEHITLRFTDATDGIKAGVPYMVRNTSLTDAITSFPVSNVRVNTNKIPAQSTDHVVFRGVYARQQIPAGAYFISDNKFYKAVDTSVNTSAKPDMISGFRGYFHVLEKDETANVRSLILRIEDEGTDIEIVEAEDSVPVVVAIYNLAGMRLDTMQPGVNILRMSDGTTVTRIVK